MAVLGKKIVRMHGFTIIELLIATSVFSLVLLGALTGFIHAGQLFYKGVTITQTGATAKNVLDDVSSSINNSSTNNILLYPTSASGYSYDCVGNVRYTYNNLHTMIDLSVGQTYSPNSNYGILRNVVSGCSAPCATGCPAPLSSGTEMLGDHMRLSDFTITASSKLYEVNVTIAYGADDVLDQTTTPPTCIGNSQDQQFCAVSNLSTSVYAEF